MNAPVSSSMHAIIRPADAATRPIDQQQAIVAINTLTGEASSSWLRLLGPLMPLSFYLVSNRLYPGAVAFLRVATPVHDVAEQRVLPLQIEAQVRADPGREILVAEALHGAEDLTQRACSLLQQWVHEYCHMREGAVVRSFNSHREHLTSLLVHRAHAVGLSLQVHLGVPRELQAPDVVCVGPHRIPVHLADCPEPQWIEVRVDLGALPERGPAAHAVHHGLGPIEPAILGVLGQFMMAVTMREYCDDLQEQVRQRLWRHLDAAAWHYGRRITGLVLRGELDGGRAEATARIEDLRREPHEFEVVVKPMGGIDVAFRGAFSVLGISPEGYAQFTRLRPENHVLSRELVEYARSMLSGWSYAALCSTPPVHIQRALNEALRPRMRVEFGLEIEVRRIQREATLAEAEAQKTREALIAQEQPKIMAAVGAQANRYHHELLTLIDVRDRLIRERAESMLHGDIGAGTAEAIDRKIMDIDARIRQVAEEIGRHRAPLPGSEAPVEQPALAGGSRTVVGILGAPPGSPLGDPVRPGWPGDSGAGV